MHELTHYPEHQAPRARTGSRGRADNGDKHVVAVANTLRQADGAAEIGDFAGALSWLALLDAIGDELPAAYATKRQAWLEATRAKGMCI